MMTTINAVQKNNIDLTGKWKFSFLEHVQAKAFQSIQELADSKVQSFDCQVPGNFETDLVRIGKCEEPFFGMNPEKVRKQTENHDVYYYRTFEVEKILDAEPLLVFEGLDCFASVYLNAEKIAETDNMLIIHKISLKDKLLKGTNEIFIHIRPAIIEAQKFDYDAVAFGMPVTPLDEF